MLHRRRRNLPANPVVRATSSTWPLSHTVPPRGIIPMMPPSASSLSPHTSPGRIAATSPAALLRLKIRTRLQVIRGNHVVSKTDPLARATLWAWCSGCRAPSWSKRGTAEGIDPTQRLRPRIAGGFPLVPGRHRGREQLDPAGTPRASSTPRRPASSPVTETACLPRRSGPVGGLGWCCRAVGQGLTALVSQEVQNKCDEFLLVNSDFRFAECDEVFFLEMRQIY